VAANSIVREEKLKLAAAIGGVTRRRRRNRRISGGMKRSVSAHPQKRETSALKQRRGGETKRRRHLGIMAAMAYGAQRSKQHGESMRKSGGAAPSLATSGCFCMARRIM
jgi:hypothetical protein